MKVAAFVDSTEASTGAVQEAVKFAELTDSTLFLVHSTEREVRDDNNNLIREGESGAIERGNQILQDHRSKITSDELDVRTEVVTGNGNHSQELSQYVKNEGIDRAFIGHRGLTGRQEEIFGSFAKSMISQLDIPVTVIKHSEEE
jgi:nucleotide-binding universal stress UspA family protein